MEFDPVVTASVIPEDTPGKPVILLRMTVAELVDSYLGIDRTETPVLALEPFITLAGKSIERAP